MKPVLVPGGRRLARTGAALGLLGLLGLPLLASCGPTPGTLDWKAVDTLIAEDFPGVPRVTPRTLAERIASGREPVVLLDARAADEFAVSHLRGAHHVGSDVEAASQLAASDADALVVVYCSVGYRSAALVGALRERGHAAVNLDGSLFRWVTEGHPVYRGSTRVAEVHPYDESWGTLLPAHLWAFEPTATGQP